MITAYYPVKTTHLIEDVAPPTIGDALAKQPRKVTIPVKSQTISAHTIRLTNTGKMTFVPPMRTLSYSRHLQQVPHKNPHRFSLLTGFAHLQWLPKKYTARKGLITDWHTRTFSDLKFAGPIIGAFYLLMLGALAWPLTTIENSPGHTRYIKNTSAVHSNATGQTSSSTPAGPATTTSTVAPQRPSTPTNIVPSATNTAASPVLTSPSVTIPADPVAVDPGTTVPANPTDDVPPVVTDPVISVDPTELQIMVPVLDQTLTL